MYSVYHSHFLHRHQEWNKTSFLICREVRWRSRLLFNMWDFRCGPIVEGRDVSLFAVPALSLFRSGQSRFSWLELWLWGRREGGCFIYCRTSKVVSVVWTNVLGKPAVATCSCCFRLRRLSVVNTMALVSCGSSPWSTSVVVQGEPYIGYVCFLFVAHLFAGIPNVVDPGLEMMSRGAGDQSGATFFLIGTAVAFGPGGVLC